MNSLDAQCERGDTDACEVGGLLLFGVGSGGLERDSSGKDFIPQDVPRALVLLDRAQSERSSQVLKARVAARLLGRGMAPDATEAFALLPPPRRPVWIQVNHVLQADPVSLDPYGSVAVLRPSAQHEEYARQVDRARRSLEAGDRVDAVRAVLLAATLYDSYTHSAGSAERALTPLPADLLQALAPDLAERDLEAGHTVQAMARAQRVLTALPEGHPARPRLEAVVSGGRALHRDEAARSADPFLHAIHSVLALWDAAPSFYTIGDPANFGPSQVEVTWRNAFTAATPECEEAARTVPTGGSLRTGPQARNGPHPHAIPVTVLLELHHCEGSEERWSGTEEYSYLDGYTDTPGRYEKRTRTRTEGCGWQYLNCSRTVEETSYEFVATGSAEGTYATATRQAQRRELWYAVEGLAKVVEVGESTPVALKKMVDEAEYNTPHGSSAFTDLTLASLARETLRGLAQKYLPSLKETYESDIRGAMLDYRLARFRSGGATAETAPADVLALMLLGSFWENQRDTLPVDVAATLPRVFGLQALEVRMLYDHHVRYVMATQLDPEFVPPLTPAGGPSTRR